MKDLIEQLSQVYWNTSSHPPWLVIKEDWKQYVRKKMYAALGVWSSGEFKKNKLLEAMCAAAWTATSDTTWDTIPKSWKDECKVEMRSVLKLLDEQGKG